MEPSANTETGNTASATERIEAMLSTTLDEIRREAQSVARTGEANMERLVNRVIEALVREIAGSLLTQSNRSPALESSNDLAAGLARAVSRGARF